MSLAPAALFWAAAFEIKRLLAAGVQIDAIDGHYIYPDGVAAVALGKAFNKPVVLTARGSDITQFPNYVGPRRMIKWAMRHAAALISVSNGLKTAMVELGALDEKVTVLRNGVDLNLFRPSDPGLMRKRLGVDGKFMLSVGHLIERKGHHLAIEALTHLPDWTLVIIGDGPERPRLQALATQLTVDHRVIFAGTFAHAELPACYSAADVLVLASSREGWANVLLEAMACGTPVVASNIPGNPEVVSQTAAGIIVKDNTAIDFAEGVKQIAASGISRQSTRAYAEMFGWSPTTQGQVTIFDRVISDFCRQSLV